MPTYTLRAPNGKTYSIEGPPGATEAQVRAEILRRDPSAGQAADREKPTGLWEGLKKYGAATVAETLGAFEAIPGVREFSAAQYNAGAMQAQGMLGSPAASYTSPEEIKAETPAMVRAGRAERESVVPYTNPDDISFGKVFTDPGKAIPAAAEQGFYSLPGMAQAITMPAVGTMGLAGQVAYNRADANQTERPSSGDWMIAAPVGAASTALERIGAKGMLGPLMGGRAVTSLRQVPGAVAKAAVTEGLLTEAPQSLLEYAGSSIGTQEPFSAQEALRQMEMGALTGGVMGAGVRTPGAVVEGFMGSTRAPGVDDTPMGEAPPAPGDVDAGIRAFAAKYRLDPEDPAVRARVRELMGLPPVEEPVDAAGRPDAGGAEPSVSGDSGGGGGGQPAAEAAVPVVGGLEPAAEPAGQPDGLQGAVDPALTPAVRARRAKGSVATPTPAAPVEAAPVAPPVETAPVAQPVEAVAQPVEAAPAKGRRAKAQAAPIDEVVPETTLPPLVQAAQLKAVELFGDDTKKVDTFLRGVAFEVEGVKLNPPEGKNARDLLNAGRQWYTENKANVDADTGAVATEVPAAIKTPEPLKVVGAPKMRRTPEGETTREVTLSDGSTVSLFRDIHQFGAHQPVWYVNDPLSAESTEYEGGLGSTLKEALEYLPTRLTQGRARAEAKAPKASPAAPTREIEPVAAEPATPQPPAEFDTDAVLQQAYEVATERVARSNQKAFRQGAEEAVGVKPFSAQEDIDKLSPKKRAAYQAGWQFVRDARGERASPTAISDQAIAEGATVKKGRAASAQGLKATNRDQVFSRDEVDPEDIAGDLSPEQQEQQAVYAEMEQARQALRINDADFAALVTLRRRGAPSSAVREELRRLSSKSKAGVEPTREGQMRGQTMSNAGQRYREGVAPATPMALEDTAAEVRRASKGWKNSPVFEVVDTFTSLPKGLQAVARPTTRGASVAAEDRVYIVADQHGSLEEVRATVFHEALGHAGLAKVFGEELRALLVDLYNTNPQLKAATDTWLVDNPDAYKDMDEDTRRIRATEEVLAEAVEDGAPQLPAFRRVFAALKDLLRKFLVAMGRKTMDYSDADVLAILAKASDAVMGGKSARAPTSAGPGTDPRFMYIGRRGAEVAAAGGREYADNQYPVALDMEADGLEPERIRLATGWFRNPYDNQWRYEIADDTAELVADWGDVPAGVSMRLDEVLIHPALYAAYPEARALEVIKAHTGEDGAFFSPARNYMQLDFKQSDPMDSLLHEVQHYVQHKEGFAQGASTETVVGKMSEQQREKLAQDILAYTSNKMDRVARDYSIVTGALATPEVRSMFVADKAADVAWDELKKLKAEASDAGATARGALLSMQVKNKEAKWLGLDKAARKEKEGVKEYLRQSGVYDAYSALYALLDPRRDDAYVAKRAQIDKIEEYARSGDIRKLTAAARWAELLHNRYAAVAGEIEARDTSARREMDGLERERLAPLTSEPYRDPSDVVVTYSSKSGGDDVAASQSPPPGGPTGAPPSTPNAPLGGKVEVARMLRSRLDGFTRAVNYKYQDAEATSRELLKVLGLDKLAEDKDFAKRFRGFEAAKGGGQEILDRRFIKPLEQAVKDGKLDLQDVGLYLWARAAPGRNAMIAKINGEYPDGGSGLTNQEADKRLKELKAKGLKPALERVAKLHDKLVDHMLSERVAAGLMSQQDVTDIRQEQPFYTPLKGFAVAGDMQIDGMDDPHAAFRPERRNMALSEFRRATGRKSMPFNPLLNLIVDASMVTLRADTNEVGRTFLNTLREFPVEMASVATYYKEKGDTPGKPKLKRSLKDPISGKSSAYAENLRAKGNELMIVKDGGETYFVEFANTPEGAAMRRAFVNLRPAQMGKLMQVATTTTRVLKQLLTTRSPSYMLGPAFIRDIMDTYASAIAAATKKGGPAYGLPLAQKVRQNLFSAPTVLNARTLSSVAGYAFGKSPKTLEQAMDMALLEQMIQDGGSVGHSLIKSVETYAEDAAKRLQRHAQAEKGNPLASIGEKVAAAGQAMDATAQMYDLFGRFATYKAALELGVSRTDAAELALDASLNLTRRGEWSQVMDNLFFFFSPTVEGARKFISMGLSGRNGVKVMTSFAALGFATTLWNLMMSSDDEDDDGRPDFLDINDTTRQTRMILYHGRGPDDYVTLPLGFMGAYPQYVGSRIAEVAYGLNSEEAAGALIAAATVDLGRGIFSAMSPVRPSGESAEDMVASSMPNLVKPFFDLTVNRNFFGSPIYNKQYDGRVARSTVGREGTGEFWKWMARSLNEMTGGVGTVSGTVDFQPEAYRYLVESFAGGAYRTGRDAVRGAEALGDGEAKITDAPILRGFLGKGSEYVPMSNFYKNSYDLDGVLFLEKYGEDEEWADLQRRRPVQTDPRVLDAFEAASKEIDTLNRQRREELKAEKEAGNDLNERRAIVDFYREEARGVYEEFNRTYNEVRRELGRVE